MKIIKWYVVLIITLFSIVFISAQKFNKDYTIMIKIENKTSEESLEIMSYLYKYAESKKLEIEMYSAKDYDRLLQLKSRTIK